MEEEKPKRTRRTKAEMEELREAEGIKPKYSDEAEAKLGEVELFKLVITEDNKRFFKDIGLETSWLSSIANQYNFDKFQYMPKFKAFQCYQDGRHVDWLSVNDLGLINVKKELTVILLKHQPLQKNKQVIKLPWRK